MVSYHEQSEESVYNLIPRAQEVPARPPMHQSTVCATQYGAHEYSSMTGVRVLNCYRRLPMLAAVPWQGAPLRPGVWTEQAASAVHVWATRRCQCIIAPEILEEA